MPPLHVLLKPASSACNLHCAYCFYRELTSHKAIPNTGQLSLELAEQLVYKAIAYAEGNCHFAFQGGEPTLAGLGFFKHVVGCQKRWGKPGLRITNALQTNGICLDDAWAGFLKEHHFLVGLSIDGPAFLHNNNRSFPNGKGSFNQVMRAAKLLRSWGVPFNILCVLTQQNARHIEKIYRFFRNEGFNHLQFIPCLDPEACPKGSTPRSLTAQEYGSALVRLFDLWHADWERGRHLSIRQFSNWLGMLQGQPPESCNMCGHCSIQCVVEADGNVYPCDFYVADQWKLGNIRETQLEALFHSEAANAFLRESLIVPEPCKQCKWYTLCRNGCRRERRSPQDTKPYLNHYCQAYHSFFTQRFEKMLSMVR